MSDCTQLPAMLPSARERADNIPHEAHDIQLAEKEKLQWLVAVHRAIVAALETAYRDGYTAGNARGERQP